MASRNPLQQLLQALNTTAVAPIDLAGVTTAPQDAQKSAAAPRIIINQSHAKDSPITINIFPAQPLFNALKDRLVKSTGTFSPISRPQ